MQVNGHTLANVSISTTADGRRIFMADLLGARGKVVAGYVCGRVDDVGAFSDVLHVNGRNQRRLS